MIAADVGGLERLHNAGGDQSAGSRAPHRRLGRALESLVTAPKRLAELAAQAPRHAENFSWEHTADGLLESYRKAAVNYNNGTGPSDFACRVRGVQWRLR